MSRTTTASRAPLLFCLVALAAMLTAVSGASALGVSPALRAADHARDSSDRALISDAQATRTCTRLHPKRCQARRAALQRAGRRLARADRQFAHKSVLTERRALVHPRQSAPTLNRGQGKLNWNKVADVRSYLVIGKSAGMTSQYTLVKSTEFDPPVVPGKTITYRVRTAVNGSAWSTPSAVAYAAKPRTEPDSSPIPTLSGTTLSWTSVGDVQDYVVVRKIAGRADVYSTVHGTSLQLPEVPGATAVYSVRTSVTGSAWSPGVTITFPAAPTTQATTTTTTQATPQASSTPGFQVGLVMRNWADNDSKAAAVLHPKVVRFEVDATNPSSGDQWVDFYASIGATPQPLADFDGVPTMTQVDALATWARSKAGKIKLLEFGNEDAYTYKYGDGPGDGSYQARARAYGAAVKRLGQDLAGSGVGVLAQGEDAGTGSSVWIDQMFAAAPDLQNYVAGWTVHPYGTSGVSKVIRTAAQVAKYDGGKIKLYATEMGVATDNGRTLSDNYGYAPNESYQAAADTLTSAVAALKATGKLAEVMLYQSTDQKPTGLATDREYYFGLMQADGTTTKGALTQAAITLLAS